MCFSQPEQPKPDINKPDYKPWQIGENMKLTYTPTGGEKVILNRQPKDGNPKRKTTDSEYAYPPGMVSPDRRDAPSSFTM